MRHTVTAMAHRGFSGALGHDFENSMRAFDAAVELGYTWVETDVHATSDGVLLAFHDSSLDRVTDSRGLIAELPWSKVSQARIAGSEPIPQLATLLERHPDLNLNIDIKSDAAVLPLVRCIDEHDAHDRVRVTSFSERRRRRALAQLSRPVRTSPGQELMAALWLAAHVPVIGRVIVARLARGLDALQIPEQFGRVKVLDQHLLNAAHAANLQVHIWTVNDPSDMRRLLDMGVDGLITDRADILKSVLDSRGEWPTAENA